MSSHLAILNKLEDSLDILDLATMTFGVSIALPPHPHELLLSRDKQTLYASIYGDGVYGNNVHPGHEIYVIDVAGLMVRSIIDIKPHRGPHAMAEDPSGKLWVTCDDTGEVIVLDPTSGAIECAIDMGGHGGHFLVMTADGKCAFVSNKDSDHLTVLDCVGRAIVDRVPTDEGCEGLCLTPDGRRIFVMSHMGSPLPNPKRAQHLSIYVVDVETLKVIDQVALPGLPAIPLDADTESRVTVTPDGRAAIVSAFKWNSLVVLDAETLKIRRTLLVDAEPMNFAYRDDDPGTVHVANHGAGVVSRFDVDAMAVTDRWPSTPPGRRGRPEHLVFLDRA